MEENKNYSSDHNSQPSSEPTLPISSPMSSPNSNQTTPDQQNFGFNSQESSDDHIQSSNNSANFGQSSVESKPAQPIASENTTEPKSQQPITQEKQAQSVQPPKSFEPGLVDSSGNRSPYSQNDDLEGESKNSTIISTIVIIIIIVLGIWYFNRDAGDQLGVNSNQNANTNEINVVVDDQQQPGQINIISEAESQNQAETVKITAFYSNLQKDPGATDCAKVYALEREVEKKYDSDVVNTVKGLLLPLTDEEKLAGWISNIPAGTYLIRVDATGSVATIKLSDNLNNIGGSCTVSAVRSQIERTLLQYPYVSSVVICAGENCNQDEILQP
ncbi:MAG TPA: GerMN domain-containing protein [Patescibacteria group bacterium]|nr:GerMN domain-containing protein [Patescibacteria group bacterium]